MSAAQNYTVTARRAACAQCRHLSKCDGHMIQIYEIRQCCVYTPKGRCPEIQPEIACEAHLKQLADSGTLDHLLPGTVQIRNTPEEIRYVMANRRLEAVPGALILLGK